MELERAAPEVLATERVKPEASLPLGKHLGGRFIWSGGLLWLGEGNAPSSQLGPPVVRNASSLHPLARKAQRAFQTALPVSALSASVLARIGISETSSPPIGESCGLSNIIVRIMNLWNASVLRYKEQEV